MAKKTTTPKKQTKKNSKTSISEIPKTTTPTTTGNEENNKYVLKLTGKAESPTPLKIGHNLHVSLEGSIVSETRSDNEDGSFTSLYAFKPIRVAMLTEKGETIKMKDTRSNSQLVRSLLWKEWANSASQLEMDFDEFYDKVSKTMMFHIKEIVAWMERENAK